MAQYNHSVVMHLGGTNKLIIDTRAIDHVTSDPKVFDELCDYVRDPYITSANEAPSPVKGECTISLTPTLSLVHALFVPDVKCNLLSVVKLLDTLYCSAHFYPTYCYFQDIQTQKIIGRGKRVGSLYNLTIENTVVSGSNNHQVLSAKVDDRHQICDSEFKCEKCVMAKSHRAFFPVSDSKATLSFDLIHSDVWGLAKVTSNGFRWYANNKKGYKYYHPPTQKTYITMDVTFHEEVSYFVKPSSDSPLQGKRESELATDSDRSPIIPGTISTDDKLDVPSELPVSMSDELPSNDRLPVADMSNELTDDDLSSDDSSNSLVQDGGIHEVNFDDSSTYQLPPRANRGKPKETFAPVAKLNNVRILLFLAANQDWPLLQLRKALYGLKQSPRAWFRRFTSSMKKFGYIQSHSDHTLFLKRQNGKLIALIIYVDDMIVTGDYQNEIQRFQKYLATEFEMKELGELKYFLGIKIARSKHGIFQSQRKYVLDLLAETGMLDCKSVDTLIEQNHRLGLFPNQVPTYKERNQRLVGRLIYLSRTRTRPDIAYAVSLIGQVLSLIGDLHLDTLRLWVVI
ncbi:uncharacterized protein [Malus domestica]|uniref:uncharacterized protein n=1 Tax=Malus domestica TaxID=3750 RepID=UPI003974F5F6